MFPISGLPPATAAARPRRAAGAAGGFAIPPEATPAGVAAAPVATEDVSMAGMLALQEADAEAVGDREARRHGGAVLDLLTALQRSLLAGSPDPATLRQLAALAAEIPPTADPELRACLAQVRLRARVELVRYGFE